MTVQEERFYFNNDLAIYRHSNEGKAFEQALNSGNAEQVKRAAEAYYTARNGAGVTYDDENERKQAQAIDHYVSQLLHDFD